MRSKELWLVEENHATVEPDSSVAPRGMKTYSKSRIEMRNPQILKKMLEKSSQFLSSEQPCEPKSLDVALKIVIAVNLETIWFEFCGKKAAFGNFCRLWLVILKLVWFNVGDKF